MAKKDQPKKLPAPKWQHELREVSKLKGYKHNPRIIKGRKFEDLKASIDNFGMVQPLVINQDGVIIGGHARFYYLQEKKIKQASCYVPDRLLTEKEVQELNIRLNKNVAGEFDFQVLANYFDVEDLESWGFEKQDFGMDMGIGDDEEETGKGSKDKGEYKDLTFKLHENQADFVKDMIELAKDNLIVDGPNNNDKGNALYTICKEWQASRL